MKKIILFDLDGTISDSIDISVDIIFDNIKDKFDVTKKSIKNELREMTIPDIMKKYNISNLQLPFLVWKMRREMSKRVNEIKIFPNTSKVLKKLKEKNIIIGILTSNSKLNTEKILLNNKIRNYFDFIITKSSLLKKENFMLKYIKTNKLDKKNIIYIGDELRDYNSCERINIDKFIVTWGYNSKEMLRKNGVKPLVNDMDELLKKLIK